MGKESEKSKRPEEVVLVVEGGWVNESLSRVAESTYKPAGLVVKSMPFDGDLGRVKGEKPIRGAVFCDREPEVGEGDEAVNAEVERIADLIGGILENDPQANIVCLVGEKTRDKVRKAVGKYLKSGNIINVWNVGGIQDWGQVERTLFKAHPRAEEEEKDREELHYVWERIEPLYKKYVGVVRGMRVKPRGNRGKLVEKFEILRNAGSKMILITLAMIEKGKRGDVIKRIEGLFKAEWGRPDPEEMKNFWIDLAVEGPDVYREIAEAEQYEGEGLQEILEMIDAETKELLEELEGGEA